MALVLLDFHEAALGAERLVKVGSGFNSWQGILWFRYMIFL
jgi:hypothetical protein